MGGTHRGTSLNTIDGGKDGVSDGITGMPLGVVLVVMLIETVEGACVGTPDTLR